MSELHSGRATQSTPYSNTGGKYSEQETRSESLQGEILIDTFSMSMQLEGLSKSGEAVSRWTHSDEEIIGRFKSLIKKFFGDAISITPHIINGRNGFDNRLILDDGAGFIAFGGNNIVRKADGMETRKERFQLYLDGAGCERVQDWNRLYQGMCDANLAGYDVRINRVDVACDFHEGEYTFQDAITAYQDGHFTSRGRPPKSKLINDMGSNEGCTFYVGSRLGGKLFRAYEKGKQLGDKSSNWNRFEVEWLGDNKRVIPFEVLIHPKKYLAGSYPAMSFISTITEVIKTSAKRIKITYDHARYWCRLQYGKLINFAGRGLHLAPEQIIQEFYNPDGFPDRLLTMPAKIGLIPHEVTA